MKLEKKRFEFQEKCTENLKSTFLWLIKKFFSGWVGILVYGGSASVALVFGALWGINTPSSIPCPSKSSLCYQLRFNKSKVLLPEEVDRVLQQYGLQNKKRQVKQNSQTKQKGN